MVTSDPEANIAAPMHVAHSFTVRPAESELDFYAADDLDPQEGTGNLGETELTSGLYYGYVVIDLAGLLSNLGGDGDMAGQVVHNLIHLIAEVTPGAKLGSTAPYGRAGFMMVEAGDRHPRRLILDLCGPMMVFGGVAVDQVGPVRDFPALSMTSGLVANALGLD